MRPSLQYPSEWRNSLQNGRSGRPAVPSGEMARSLLFRHPLMLSGWPRCLGRPIRLENRLQIGHHQWVRELDGVSPLFAQGGGLYKLFASSKSKSSSADNTAKTAARHFVSYLCEGSCTTKSPRLFAVPRSDLPFHLLIEPQAIIDPGL